jgi:hypothetical protein
MVDVNVNEYGHGIICPFQRDGKGDFANAGGLALVRSDVAELIGIIGPTVTQPGELPWDTERGTRINAMKHRHMHAEMSRVTAEQLISGPIRIYEKRVRPARTEIVIDEVTQSTTIKFSYIPAGRQSTGKLESVSYLLPQDE